MCTYIWQLFCKLSCVYVTRLVEDFHTKYISSSLPVELYHEETLEMMISRWEKLVKDFKSVDGKFNISKIPDIYDCIKYDLIHNQLVSGKQP